MCGWLCVCVACVGGCVFEALAKFLISHIFCFFYVIIIVLICVCVCVQCACRELAHAHVALPLQSQSALSCCFHSSSESQHSQPRSLPSFTLLVPARSDSLPTSFSFFSLWLSGSLSRTGHTSASPLHSFIQTRSTRALETWRNRKERQRFSKLGQFSSTKQGIHEWTWAECGLSKPECCFIVLNWSSLKSCCHFSFWNELQRFEETL